MSKKRAPRAAAAKGRFDRDRWLAEALEILSREGSARITVRHLSERLGVTTGSFYWHFEDRRDFVRRIVDYWSEAFTETAIRYFSDVSDDPQKQLLALMTILTEQDLARYDVAVRAWAAQDTDLGKAVRKVDQRRLDLVRGMFSAMGFGQTESDIRARTFAVYHSAELAFYVKKSKKARLADLKRRHALFIQPITD